jgi:type IV secretory pathway VirB2 component (pilin)
MKRRARIIRAAVAAVSCRADKFLVARSLCVKAIAAKSLGKNACLAALVAVIRGDVVRLITVVFVVKFAIVGHRLSGF